MTCLLTAYLPECSLFVVVVVVFFLLFFFFLNSLLSQLCHSDLIKKGKNKQVQVNVHDFHPLFHKK